MRIAKSNNDIEEQYSWNHFQNLFFPADEWWGNKTFTANQNPS